MWIKLQGKYYNINHIRKVSLDEHVTIEYSDGDTTLLMGLTNEEIIKLIKILDNESCGRNSSRSI